jgi:hypothetical protein
MKKLMTLIYGFLICATAQATPPGDVTLAYDLEKQTVTASGPHPTQDMSEHYIRRFEISKNNLESKTYYFPKQATASEFKEALPVADLKAGDYIYVKVSCSEGGSKEASLHIPEENAVSAAPIDLKSLRDKDHKNMQIIP